MRNDYKFKPLGEIANVEISNIDKKSKKDENTVVLCNFIDVYNNYAITLDTSKNFMRATANNNQINRFSLHKGQVAITKDSETRDDIGIAAYIADDIENCVLGYHCALISPKNKKISGKYLNAVLHTKYAQKYFESNAGGSGQRFSLTKEVIERFPVPLPSEIAQQRIGNLLSQIDRKLEINNRTEKLLELLAGTVYNYWFVQFDFPDRNGKPYKSSGGKMVWKQDIKRELPIQWEVKSISEITELIKDGTHNPPKRVPKGIPLLTGTMFGNTFLDYDDVTYITREDYLSIHKVYQPQEGDMIITKIGTLGNVNYLRKQDIPIAIHCNSALLRFLPLYRGMYEIELLKSDAFQNRLTALKGQSIQAFVSLSKIASIKIECPPEALIRNYNEMMNPVLLKLEEIDKENQKLAKLRNFLLPLLVNGQVGFN